MSVNFTSLLNQQNYGNYDTNGVNQNPFSTQNANVTKTSIFNSKKTNENTMQKADFSLPTSSEIQTAISEMNTALSEINSQLTQMSTDLMAAKSDNNTQKQQEIQTAMKELLQEKQQIENDKKNAEQDLKDAKEYEGQFNSNINLASSYMGAQNTGFSSGFSFMA